MPRDMYSLMWYVIGVTTVFTRVTRTVACYEQAIAHDGQSLRHNIPSTSHDCSRPCAALDFHVEPLVASTNSHHGDEARSSADP